MLNTPFSNAISELYKIGDEIFNDFPSYDDILCKKCGTRLSDFLNTGFVGCSSCYKSFDKYAKNMAYEVHGRPNHIGKVPTKEASKASKKRELERLIKEKMKAVSEENYQLADQLKMRIATLREELGC